MRSVVLLHCPKCGPVPAMKTGRQTTCPRCKTRYLTLPRR